MNNLYNSKNENELIIDKNQFQTDSPTLIIENRHEIKNKQQSSILIDKELIKHFAQGKTQLLASKIFQIDYKLGTIQLILRKNGEILGISKILEANNPTFLKSNSQYLEAIQQILLENNFVPLGESTQHKGFYEYQQYDIPKNYRVNYTETMNLWKIWLPNSKNKGNYQIQLDILIFTRNKWYPIQEMIDRDGIFYIKTLIGEMRLNAQEKIVWLNKIEVATTTSSNLSKVPTEEISDSAPKNVEKSVNTVRELVVKELKISAFKILEQYLLNGEIETRTEIIKNSTGEITSSKIVTTKKPCPQWVIEYLLAQNDSEKLEI